MYETSITFHYFANIKVTVNKWLINGYQNDTNKMIIKKSNKQTYL